MMNKVSNSRARFALVLAVTGLLAACGGEDPNAAVGGTTPPPSGGVTSPNLSSFTLTPSTVRVGSTARATWNVTNTSGGTAPCTLTGEQNGVAPEETTNQPATTITPSTTDVEGVVITPSSTPGVYDYTFQCSGTGGTSSTVTKQITVKPVLPTVALTLTPAAVSPATTHDIAVGGSGTLSWATTGATSCVASGAWTGSVGLQQLDPPGVSTGIKNSNSTLTYTLTCANSIGETATDSEVLKVGTGVADPVFDSFSLTPSVIQAGQSSVIEWQTTGATSCTASGNGGTVTPTWTGAVPVDTPVGGFSVGTISTVGSFTYTLTCTNGSGGTNSSSVTLTVNAVPIAITDCGVAGLPTTALVTPFGAAAAGNILNCLPGACSVAGAPNLLTPSQTDFATMSINLGLDGTLGLGDALGLNSTPSLTVVSALAIPAGRKVGFMVSSGPGDIPLLGLNLLRNIVVSTVAADGTTVVQSADPDGGIELEVLTLDLGNILLGQPQRSFINFTTTAPSRGAKLQFNSSLLGLLSDLRVYAACVSN